MTYDTLIYIIVALISIASVIWVISGIRAEKVVRDSRDKISSETMLYITQHTISKDDFSAFRFEYKEDQKELKRLIDCVQKKIINEVKS